MHFGGMKLDKSKRNLEICELYFQSKMSFSEISRKFDICVSQVSRIVRKNENYINEKNKRIQETKIKRTKLSKQLMRKKRKSETKDKNDEKAILDYLHNQASAELSGRRTISNRAFKNWNSSIYEFHNRTKEFRLKKEFKERVSYAVPKKIKWD